MYKRSIGIFDSGVGGLSILQEINRFLPNESFIYIADQAYFPYGEKSQQELENRVELLVRFLEKQNVKLIVIACNTATVYAIDHARAVCQVPIVGVVPDVKVLAA